MAVEKITMPKLGESVTEGTISSWLVKPGDTVEKYDAIAEVLTDKVTAEIPSSFSGTIKEILAEEDETLEVGEVICTIETADAGSSEPVAEVEETETKAPEKQETKQVKLADAPVSGRFSPAVLRIAGENNIDLSTVEGTGKGGRITRKDLLQVIENGPVAKREEMKSAPQEKAAMPTPPVRSAAGDKEIPINGVRKAIAKHMSVSKQEIPHAWMMVEVDATGLVRYRNAVKDSFKKKKVIH